MSLVKQEAVQEQKEREQELPFHVGEYVSYGRNSICRITDIRYEKFGDAKKLYYVLRPVYDEQATIYVSVHAPTLEEQMKHVLSKEEIDAVIAGAESIKRPWIANSKERQIQYEQMLRSGRRTDVLWLVKVLGKHKEDTIKEGRKFYSSDERILQAAERIIIEEFAFVLHMDKEEVISYIIEKCKMTDE